MDGAHAASCEEMSTALSKAEAAAYKGLQQCIETVMAEVSCFFRVFFFFCFFVDNSCFLCIYKQIHEDQCRSGFMLRIFFWFILKTVIWHFSG